jgi:hypothetical protein
MNNSLEQYAKETLRPHFDKLQECYDKAFEELKEHITINPNLTERTKANIVRDAIVENVRIQFNDLSEFKIIEANKSSEGLVVLLIEGKIALRFKKLNTKNGFTVSNNPTDQSRNLLNQNLELSDGLDTFKPIFVNAGYILNKTGMNYSSLHLVCNYGEKILWDINIDANNIKREETADTFNFKGASEAGIKQNRKQIKPINKDLDEASNDDK